MGFVGRRKKVEKRSRKSCVRILLETIKPLKQPSGTIIGFCGWAPPGVIHLSLATKPLWWEPVQCRPEQVSWMMQKRLRMILNMSHQFSFIPLGSRHFARQKSPSDSLWRCLQVTILILSGCRLDILQGTILSNYIQDFISLAPKPRPQMCFV